MRNAAQELYDEVLKKNIEIEYLIKCVGFGEAGQFLHQSLEYNHRL